MIPCFSQTTRTSYDRNCRQPRISNVPRPGNSMDRNLHAEKHCDKRFLDRVINLIPDSGLKALWSLILFFWALSLFLWALIPVIFLLAWAHIRCYDPVYKEVPPRVRNKKERFGRGVQLNRFSILNYLVLLLIAILHGRNTLKIYVQL